MDPVLGQHMLAARRLLRLIKTRWASAGSTSLFGVGQLGGDAEGRYRDHSSVIVDRGLEFASVVSAGLVHPQMELGRHGRLSSRV